MTTNDQRTSSAIEALNSSELESFCRELTEIPSPSGFELEAAKFVLGDLVAAGVGAELQNIGPNRANVIARISSGLPGPILLLYASLDTAFSGNDEEDRPWLGNRRRQDFSLKPEMIDGHLVGLGAENPKAFVTAVAAAAKAISRAGGPPVGEVQIGIAAGGMPITERLGVADRTIGFGSGCAHMLQRGMRPDFALVAKPGWAIQTEETGLCWFRVDVSGTLSYTGTKHFLKYRNAIVDAAKVIVALEEWFAEYSSRHKSEYLSPQGSIGAIHAGHPGRSAFVPPRCSFYVDLRTDPDVSPLQVERELREALSMISAANNDIQVDVTMLVSVPGGRTAEAIPFTRAAVEAWEAVEGAAHEPRRGMSGISDAAVLRGQGIPTLVVGLPQTGKPEEFAGFSMGVVRKENILKLTQLLVRAAFSICSEEFATSANDQSAGRHNDSKQTGGTR